MAQTDSIALRREVLLAGQSVFLFEGTVGENFDAFCEARESATLAAEDKQKFLRLCCANFPLDAPCVHLSGGERQRVFLAICLSFLPKVLMLDEPTSALDQETAERFMAQVLAFCRERGMACACRNRRAPTSVSSRFLPRRSRATPNSCSSASMAWDTPDCEIPSCRAAAVKPRRAATVENISSWVSVIAIP